MRLNIWISILFVLWLPASFADEAALRALVSNYIDTYAERTDIDKLLSFYADEFRFYDEKLNLELTNKQELSAFFDWQNPHFKVMGDKSLRTSSIDVADNKVIVKGWFNPFKWGQKHYEQMPFTMTFTFDEHHLILSHTDNINYPDSLLNPS